ncbi:MAG: hypothetical protein OHK0029_31650 [Armatimonadaceae bacterium]
MLNPDRYLLFVEERSRYDNEIKTLLPVEIPPDGMQRVIVDHEHAARLDPEDLSYPRTEEQRISFLQADSPYHRYSVTVARAAAALAQQQEGESPARLWCVGEMSRRFATVLPEASGIEMVQLRIGILSSLVAFSLPPSAITSDIVLPFFANDYGARLFVFHQPGTDLEHRLAELCDVMRRDSDATEEAWRRGDWERTVRRALTDRGEVLSYSDEDELPPTALETVRRWQELQDDCWYRERLRGLLEQALLCVLPDGKHDGAVAFHSVQLPVHEVVETLCAVVREQGGSTSIIAYSDEG